MIEATAGEPFTVTFRNDDSPLYNLEFLDRRGGSPLTPDAKGKIIRRAEIDVLTFTPPGPGTY